MNIDLHLSVTMASYAGAGLCIGIGAIGAAIGEGYTAAQATLATGRRPELSGEIFKTMLVWQAISESSSIFSLVVALVLMFTAHQTVSTVSIVVPLAAGLCMGFGSLGAGIGAGYPAAAACTGIARQPGMASRLNTNMIIGSAVCQTPATFSLVISFILLYSNFSGKPASPTWAAVLGAGLATGLAAIGPGLGGGLVAQAGCEGTARNPEQAKTATNVMLLGQAIAQTTAIYGLLVSFILIFKSFRGRHLCRRRRHRPGDRRGHGCRQCRDLGHAQPGHHQRPDPRHADRRGGGGVHGHLFVSGRVGIDLCRLTGSSGVKPSTLHS
jgi:ATP synthase F0 subunit c